MGTRPGAAAAPFAFTAVALARAQGGSGALVESGESGTPERHRAPIGEYEITLEVGEERRTVRSAIRGGRLDR